MWLMKIHKLPFPQKTYNAKFSFKSTFIYLMKLKVHPLLYSNKENLNL